MDPGPNADEGRRMAALAAVLLRGGRPLTAERFAAVADSLAPFGAESCEWRSGPVGLVRKSDGIFTPEDEFDRQPAAIEGGGVLLFDGFLHHRGEAAAALGIDPHEAAGQADSALFARAWERWGEDAALRVDGEFAVLLWDAGRRALTAVCSPFMSPPLYFAMNRRRVLAASAPRGIFAFGDLSRRLNDRFLADRLVVLNDADPRCTFYEDVHALSPGEVLTVSCDDPEGDCIRRYYDLRERIEPVRLPRTEDYIEAGAELLRRAVKGAMRAAETPAVLLSGGFDSTSMAVTALEIAGEDAGALPLISFTGCPEPGWDGRSAGGVMCDESVAVRALARKYPALDARFVRAEGLDADYLQQRMIELAEHPMRNAFALHWPHECRRLARAAGRRTVLTGYIGGQVLNYHGLERLPALLRRGRLLTLLRELPALPRGRYSRRSSLFNHVIAPLLPDRLYGIVRKWRTGDPFLWSAHSAIHPDYARAMRVEERACRQGFLYSGVKGYASCREARLQRLLSPADSMHMTGFGRSTRLALRTIHGVVDRDPFSDRRLTEWGLGLPDEQFLDHGRSKLLVRRMMAGRLPDEILSAPPGLQAADWHLRTTRALPRIRETLLRWCEDPGVAGRIDLDRLLRVVDTWPKRTPICPADHPEYRLAWHGLDRALVTGRFIRWVESGTME